MKLGLFGVIIASVLICSSSIRAIERAYYPIPGFTCCNTSQVDLLCSIAESIIAGLIFPSCPCSTVCRLEPDLLDNDQTIDKTQMITAHEHK